MNKIYETITAFDLERADLGIHREVSEIHWTHRSDRQPTIIQYI